MNKYEDLQDNACEDGLDVIDYHFDSDRIKGLYCDGTIALNSDLTQTEKTCVLAEELGHHHTAVGNIIDQRSDINRKKEHLGRVFAYNKLIGLVGLVHAYQDGCRSWHDAAAHLEVTEEFLRGALEYYRQRYGCSVKIDNYVIFFEPHLAVMELK